MKYLWKIIYIGGIETVWSNDLQKRTVALEEVSDKEYKWWISFDLIKDKVNIIDWFKLWDTIEVSLNFKTNYYEKTGRYYNSITAWKLEWMNKDDSHAFPEADEVFFF